MLSTPTGWSTPNSQPKSTHTGNIIQAHTINRVYLRIYMHMDIYIYLHTISILKRGYEFERKMGKAYGRVF